MLTSNCSCTTAASIVIYDHRIAFYHPVDSEVAAVARVGDLLVLQDPHCHLYVVRLKMQSLRLSSNGCSTFEILVRRLVN